LLTCQLMIGFQPAHVVVAAYLMLSITACHNTAQGVKTDTHRAVEKVDQKLDREEQKHESHERNER
jgi:predicted small secreted protein